jgi:hypothetical protein
MSGQIGCRVTCNTAFFLALFFSFCSAHWHAKERKKQKKDKKTKERKRRSIAALQNEKQTLPLDISTRVEHDDWLTPTNFFLQE